MREIDIYEYFRFGYNYGLLEDNTLGRPVLGNSGLITLLEGFFAALQDLNMQVTRKAADALYQIFEDSRLLPQDAIVDKVLSTKIATEINKLNVTLDAELRLRYAWVLTQKRVSFENLLKSPNMLFAAKVFEHLPEISRFDFAEACRCIAFDLPTAAAFHLMRGTEGVLRFYYLARVKRNRIKRLMWGDMITNLRQRRDPPPKALMDNLDNIRINFRNPTQHPEARYDMDEAQDLLFLSIDVVNRMIKELAPKERELVPEQ